MCHPSFAATASRSRRRMRPRFALYSRPPNRGRRECRAADAPAVSCAMVVVERTRAYRSHRNHPALPAQWFYGLYRTLPGAPGLLATVAPEKLSPPGNLTPASGCQDHTILPYASGALVSRTVGVHRSPPRERDDRVSPPLWDGMGKYRPDFHFGKAEYFFKWGLTEGSRNHAGDLPVG